MVSHFHEKRFPRIRCGVITIASIQNCKGFSLIVFSLFILSVSWIFLSYMYGEMRAVFECSQSNCPSYSAVCSVAPDDFHFSLMLSCWCSIYCVRTLFFDSPIYFQLHEKSNWYTLGWLFGSSFGLSPLTENLLQIFWRRKGNIFPYFLELTVYFWTDVWNPR